MNKPQPVYVSLEDGERELLLELLDTAGFEVVQARDAEESAGNDVSDLAREEAQISVMYERIEQRVPLTRADVLRALRLIEGLPTFGWPRDKAENARRLYTVLRARSTNALRLARQAERVS